MNLDGIGAIYTPMVHAEPTMILYFATFMLIVSICLMNMVTAVIVESSFEQAKTDRDFAKSERSRALQKLMPQVREIFQKLDLDGSGNVIRAAYLTGGGGGEGWGGVVSGLRR